MPSSCSVAQSRPTLCSPIDCRTWSFHVFHHIPEFSHVHWVSDVNQPSYPLPCLSLPAFNLSLHQGLFQWVNSSDGWSIGASASASVHPMNIQGWFLLESDWLVWSPCSPRNSQVSSPTPQFKHINSLVLRLLYGPTLTSIHDYWKNHSFE